MENDLKRAISHLRRSDPVLARIIQGVGPCRLEVDRKTPHFAVLVESILYQQITGKAAATIHNRLLELAQTKRIRPRHILALEAEALRKIGLSRQKASYVLDLAQRAEGGLPLGRIGRLGDEAVIEALTEVKGIGRWTAHMFLMFRLGRMDVLPIDDYGIQKAVMKAYRMRALPKAKRLTKIAHAWRPYRTVACWYLWRSLDAPSKEE